MAKAGRAERSAAVQLDRDVCHLVHSLAHRLDVHVRGVAQQLGMTPTQVIALRELSDPVTARELAGRMFCEASNVTFVLDRLAEQGFIQRQPHPTDRRAKQIVLTAAGVARREEVLDGLRAGSPLGALDGGQQEALREVLRALAE